MTNAEKVPRHVYTMVEGELYRYKESRSLIDAYEDERKTIMGATGQSLKDTDRFSQNQPTDPTSGRVFRLMAMEERVNRSKWYVKAIEDTFSQLDELDKRLVEMKYFQQLLTSNGIQRELHISHDTFCRKKNLLIEKFARRMGLI